MRKWLVCLAIPALLLSACSGSDAPAADEDPLGALVSAIRETGSAEQQVISFTIQSTPESLVAASAEEDEPLSPEMAEVILGSSLSISVVEAEDPQDQSGRLTLSIPGSDGAEVLLAGPDLYLRADVRGIASVFEQDTAPIDEFLASGAAAQYPFIESAVNGEFLKIEGSEAFTGGATGTDQLTAQQEQLINEFADAIREEAEVTFEGEDDVGDHFLVSAPVQALYQRFTEISSQFGTEVPETDLPEGDVSLDVWVADGRIAQIEVDAIRLAEEFEADDIPEGVEQLAFRLTFGYEVEEPEVPEDAVTVSGEELMGLIFSGGFGTDTTTPETTATPDPGETTDEFDCSVYEDLPPETFEGLPQETLDQLEAICPGIVPD